MNTGFSVLIALLLTLFQHGHINANIQTTADVTVTPSVTPTETITPTVTPSETVTPTETITPTVTVTPTVSPSPEPTGIWNGIRWVPANIRAFFGLSNAARHHEINDERFESKHGVKPTHAVEPTETEENESE
jgi:hypothetical protein